MIYYFSGGTADDLVYPLDARQALTGDMEIEFVFRMEKTNARGAIVSFSGYDNTGVETAANNTIYSVFISATNRIGVFHEYGNGTNVQFIGANSLPLTWLRVKVVRVGLTYELYLNGNLTDRFTFTSAQAPTFNSQVGPSMQLRVGMGYFEQTASERLAYVSIAYLKIRNSASGNDVFLLGEDPGGAPGAKPPFMGARVHDPYVGMFTRPAQTKQGIFDYESYGGMFVRPPQRANGILYDLSGVGRNEGTAPKEINKPRSFPLETRWKKANPSKFSK